MVKGHLSGCGLYTCVQSVLFNKGGLHLKPLKFEHIFVAVRPRNICEPTSSNPRNSGMLHVNFFLKPTYHSYVL